ncbi:MAG: nitrilase-related carbon-nitrogen hydrolase [Blautia wexlerae]
MRDLEVSKLAVCICHDGMIPELAREAAYKGCNVYIRISGYSTQVNDQWILTNRSNAWQNLMYTVSVNLAGYDGVFYYFGEKDEITKLRRNCSCPGTAKSV